MFLRNRLRIAITRLIEAEIAEHDKGGGDPADYHIIEQEVREARADVERLLDKVQGVRRVPGGR